MDISLAGLDGIIRELKGSAAKYKEERTYNKDAFEQLRDKYTEAIEVIEFLKAELDKKNNELPSADDIASINAMIPLMQGLGLDPAKMVQDEMKKRASNEN